MTTAGDGELERRIVASAIALAEEFGLEAVTVNAVAQHAGVSRPTVYRRFPNRAALVFELQLLAVVPVDMPDTGTFHEDLRQATTYLMAGLRAWDRTLHGERLALMAADPDFAAYVWRERWIPDREAVAAIWDRALARGEVDPDVDGRAVIDDLVSAAVFRVLFWHENSDDWIGPYVDRLCRGVRR